jgi:hypothetical protein
MTGHPTALSLTMAERSKARVRLPLLLLLAIVGPPLAGAHSPALWTFYVLFGLAYSLWSLRLTQTFSTDRRLGYLLVGTDCAFLLPLAAWSSGPGVKILVGFVCAGGAVVTCLSAHNRNLPQVRRQSRGLDRPLGWAQRDNAT